MAAARAGSKLLLGGGVTYPPVTASNRVDIYDEISGQWSVEALSQARWQLAATGVGSKALFAGGTLLPAAANSLSNRVDVYDAAANTWSTSTLSQARMELTAVSGGGKAFFAGGWIGPGSENSDAIDVYEPSSGSWTVAHLSQARQGLASASAGDKVVFAGGWASTVPRAVVDIYDVSTNGWSTATLSRPRRYLSAAVAGHRILFAGGDNSVDAYDDVDIYDTQSGTWSVAHLSQARHDLAGASVGSMAIFAGGVRADGVKSAVVDIYDGVSGTWSTGTISLARQALVGVSGTNVALFAGGDSGTPSPTDRADLARLDGLAPSPCPANSATSQVAWNTKAPFAPPGRFGAGAAEIGGKVYVAGGTEIGAPPSNRLDVFDPATNSWTAKAPMNVARYMVGVAAANGRLYVAGGLDSSNTASNLLEEYTPQTNTWRTLPVMPEAGHENLAAANGKLYTAGGYRNGDLPTLLEFDTATEAWTQRASMPLGARSSVALAAASDGSIYAIGGGNGQPLGRVERYDPSTDIWSTRASMPTPRLQHGAALLPDAGRIYVMGGNGSTGAETAFEEYDPATDRWSTLTAMPASNFRLASAAVGDRVYAIGGDLQPAATLEAQVRVCQQNRPPNLGQPGNVTVDEGQVASNEGTYSDPDAGDNVTITASVGTVTKTGTNSGTWAWRWQTSDGPADSRTATITADDGHGGIDSKPFELRVNNVPPTPAPSCASTAVEGTAIACTATATDPSPVDTAADFTFGWTVTKNGAPYGSGSGTTFTFTPDDNADYALTLKATDKDGGTATAPPWLIAVSNAAPGDVQVTPTSAVINENQTVSVSGSFTDPGVRDTHKVTIAWGDGSPDTTVDLAAGVLAFGPVSHQYLDDMPTDTASDQYRITVTVRDNDGATGTGGTTVTVNNLPPAIVDLVGPASPLPLGSATANVIAAFTDAGTLDTHTCTFSWGDSTSSAVAAAGIGNGSCSATHTYGTVGVYTVGVTVTDDDTGRANSTFQYVVVYDPSGGFVTGGGWINSPAGACALTTACQGATGQANFGFVSKYLPGRNTPSGSTEFQFQAGGLNFKSTAYESLVVSGYKAQYKGTGTVNGMAGYSFVLTAYDGDRAGGDGVDRFRLQIKDGANNVVYDNGSGSLDLDATPPPAIAGGSIQIQRTS